jgi:alkanesulfonate monooxygenase SsuD/methylene tetrahydromethanopterin reductase-like flavin-dependent oxidoreductase (luciferase family)
MPSVLLAPFRSAAVLAKEVASLDALSGGRLTIGAGVGWSAAEFAALGQPFENRGRRMDEMLAQITRLWGGEEVGDAGGVGPDVRDNPPQLLIGGLSDQAFRRAAEFGDGWILGAGSPGRLTELAEKLDSAWRERGREGEPRRVAITYFALGDDPEGDARRSIGHYYSFAPDYAETLVQVTAKGDDAVRERLEELRQGGADELVMFPSSPDPEQVELLARIAL